MTNDRVGSPVSDGLAATSYRQTTVIAGAMAGAILAYVVVVEMLMRTGAVIPPPYFQTLRIALFVIAGVMIFTTTIVKGLMLRSAPADPAARLARLRTATMVGLALSEVPVVCGVVLVAIGRARQDFYMLLVISVYMLVRHFPRRGAWEEYLRRGGSSAVR